MTNKIQLYDDKFAANLLYDDSTMARLEATTAATKVDVLITQLLTAESQLDNDYVKLGHLLFEVQKNLYWKYVGHSSFGEYMLSLADKYNKGRTQLYQYVATVRELSPYINETQMNEMGIAKAMALKVSVKRNGFPPTEEIISQALDPKVTTKDLRTILCVADGVVDEKGTWMDREGFYVTEEERLVIQSADAAALKTDPAVQQDAPDWIKRKEIALRQAMEFLSVHSS